MNNFTIARPYAIAAFYFASKSHSITEWQNIISDTITISQNDLFLRVFYSHFFSLNEISKILINSNKHKLNNFQQNFIKVLIENSRLSILPYIFKHFLMLKNIKNNTIDIEITSVYKLHDKHLIKIVNIIEKKTSKKVKLKCKIDKSIIGGVIIKIGNSVINGSIKCCLKNFQQVLQS